MHGPRPPASCYDDAPRAARRIVERGQLLSRPAASTASGPPAADGDDLVLYRDAARDDEQVRIPMLRQQRARRRTPRDRSLADFVAPRGSRCRVDDSVGAFAVTGRHRRRGARERFEADGDDYQSILTKAAGRPAGGGLRRVAARSVRARVGLRARRGPLERGPDREKYRGIRPAFGYPACPDHMAEKHAVRAARRGRVRHRALTRAAAR